MTFIKTLHFTSASRSGFRRVHLELRVSVVLSHRGILQAAHIPGTQFITESVILKRLIVPTGSGLTFDSRGPLHKEETVNMCRVNIRSPIARGRPRTTRTEPRRKPVTV